MIIIHLITIGLVLIILAITFLVLSSYFTALKPISFLPVFSNFEFDSNISKLKYYKIKNTNYELIVYENGVIRVNNASGKVILSNMMFYGSYKNNKEKLGLNKIYVKEISDYSLLISGESLEGVFVNIELNTNNEESKIDFQIKTWYSKNTDIKREAIIVKFDIPVTEVYRKNGTVDIKSFRKEYWLQKQGVRFGEGETSAVIYHSPRISSLQLDTKRNFLFINLDYYLDHPHINIPHKNESKDNWSDLSTSNYYGGNERINSFTIFFGNQPEIVPRINLVPYGYTAGFVFTEHADGGNINTHRAVYFGSEDITNSNDAIGGFVGHKIAVTKSIFYANPKGLKYSSICNDPDHPQFLDFLNQLYKTGNYEICLHTSEHLNTNPNRKLYEESIKFMKQQFDSITWIDHGMYTGEYNRESYVADGLNFKSDYYIADLWKKYNTRFFWSPAIEMIKKSSRLSPLIGIKKLKFYKVSVNFWRQYISSEELNNTNFFSALSKLVSRFFYRGELNSFMPSQGEAYPTPLYWMHPTRTDCFYSWATEYSNEYKNLISKNTKKHYMAELRKLDNLINNKGIFISHGYYIRNRKNDGTCKNENGKIIINPYFDNILKYMAKVRDQGDLYITTIKDLLEYWCFIEKISFKYFPNGEVHVYNNNNAKVKGLSISVKAKKVQLIKETSKTRLIKDDIVMWFDINAKDYVVLKIN